MKILFSNECPGTAFPKNFQSIVKDIFKRLFRVYAHIYHHHFQQIVAVQAEAHLNTCFKHFIYFVVEFELIDKKELAPLEDLIKDMMPPAEVKKWCWSQFRVTNFRMQLYSFAGANVPGIRSMRLV